MAVYIIISLLLLSLLPAMLCDQWSSDAHCHQVKSEPWTPARKKSCTTLNNTVT